MATLAEIRAQHPEYEDLSDEQLAQGLHRRFYSDMPFEDFSRRVGLGTPGYRAALREQESRREAPANDIPLPDWARPVADVVEGVRGATRFTEQIPRNLGVADEIAGGANFLRQGAQNVLRRVMGRPVEITAGEAGQAASDFQRNEGERFAREHPGQNALSIASGLAAFAPARVFTAPSATRMALTSAALQTPFAVGRQEGDLAERASAAVPEIATAGALGGTLQGLANMLVRRGAPSPTAQVLQRFDDAGVRPTLGAVQGGATAGATKMISENLIGGAGVRARLQNSLDDTAEGAERVARAFAQNPTGRETTGEIVQEGVRRFVHGDGAGAVRPAGALRNWSFDQRANELYRRVFGQIDNAIQSWSQRGQTPPVTSDATRIVLDDILGSNTGEVADLINDPQLFRFRDLVSGAGARGRTFQDLRDLRSFVRTQQSLDPSVRPTLSDAALARLESALTTDIAASAQFIAGPQIARQLSHADRFYRLGNERIRTVLRHFIGERVPGAQAFRRIIQLASEGGSQNTRALIALRRSLQPDEWRHVAATAIDEMGRVSPGSVDALNPGAFSVDRFVTNYAKLTDEGRQALFGDLGSVSGSTDQFIDLAGALDNLAQVAARQKGVEALANRSRSGVNVQNAGVGFGLATGQIMPTLGFLGGMMLTGEALTNPGFVRWLARAPSVGAGDLRNYIAALAELAARDPALGAIYADVTGQPAPALTTNEMDEVEPDPELATTP